MPGMRRRRDHSYEGVKADHEAYGRLVRPGGWIAFHDILDVEIHRNQGCHVALLWQEIGGRKVEIVEAGDRYGIGLVQAGPSA